MPLSTETHAQHSIQSIVSKRDRKKERQLRKVMEVQTSQRAPLHMIYSTRHTPQNTPRNSIETIVFARGTEKRKIFKERESE